MSRPPHDGTMTVRPDGSVAEGRSPMGIRILIVEDEAELADFVVRGLREEGFAVEHAADGELAWEAMRSGDLGPDRARLVAAGRGRPVGAPALPAGGRGRAGAVPDGAGRRRRPGARASTAGRTTTCASRSPSTSCWPASAPWSGGATGPPSMTLAHGDVTHRPGRAAGPARRPAARPDGQGAGAARPSSCGTPARCSRGRGSTTTSGTRASTGSPTRWRST